MATVVPETVLKWLQGVLSSNGYRDLNRTYYDVANALQQHPSLKLRTDVYTSERGASSLLLNAHGNLPVQFRGNVYGFPISLWIPQEYPWTAPSAFIVPSQEMVLRPGQHVSGDGKIYHPYLASWQNDRSNLGDLVSILQHVFSQEPPLVARSHQPPPPIPHHQPPPPAIPPMPPEKGRSESEPVAKHFQPTPPPKPPKGDGTSSKYDRPAPLPPGVQRGSNEQGTNERLERSGTERPRPFQAIDSASRSPPTGWQRYQAQQGPFSPSRLGPPHPPNPAYTAVDHGNPPQNYSVYQHAQPPNIDPRQSAQQLRSPPAYLAQGQNIPAYQTVPQPPKPKPAEDLLTSPFDNPIPTTAANVPPPPIPPNPEKDAILSAISKSLTQQVQSTHASNMSAIAPLRAQQSALTSTLNNINREISQLEDLEALLASNEAILHQAMHDADRVLEDAKQRKVPEVDDVLVAPTVVAGQLYQTVAEERAIEDCRAVLGRALDKGRIGSSVWAKQTRSLAREEFMKKALIKKIAKGMGLVEQHEW